MYIFYERRVRDAMPDVSSFFDLILLLPNFSEEDWADGKGTTSADQSGEFN